MDALGRVELAAGMVSAMHRKFGDDAETAKRKAIDSAKKALEGPRSEYKMLANIAGNVEECLTSEGCFLIAMNADGIDIRDVYSQENVMAAVHRGIEKYKNEGR